MTNATDTQIGGSHYRDLAIQPMPFCIANRWDPAAYGILKYITRHKQKNGRQDVAKARHLVDLRAQLIIEHGAPQIGFKISVEDYIEQNGIDGLERQALLALGIWVIGQSDRGKLVLLCCIDNILAQYPDVVCGTKPEDAVLLQPGEKVFHTGGPVGRCPADVQILNLKEPPAPPPMIDGRGNEVPVTTVTVNMADNPSPGEVKRRQHLLSVFGGRFLNQGR